ncbi:hypothetical protein CERSUDRAFT_85618 [Gelatoporia subvermispora B]|uniref:DUF6533 domain-containing protein n=1 Tax=Ceriporiopsis subvermispora (strain B) TaxID=914234 RepID=M2QF18_CERS8|nr:hypothetical protein CERSUDRAFT_85618 [Gelatoporia subvermispora B]
MSELDSDIQQAIYVAYERLRAENYCVIASSALLYADWALCFTTEVDRIWRRKFSGATVLYLLNRYAALAERATLVISVLLVTESDRVRKCARVLRTDDGLMDLGNFAISAFMVMRVLGMWGRDWRPALAMMVLVVIPPLIPIYVQAHYIPIAFGPPMFGCGANFQLSGPLLVDLDTGSNAVWSIAEILAIMLTWAKTYGIRRDSRSLNIRTPVATLLFRDGELKVLIILQIFAITSLQVGSTNKRFGTCTEMSSCDSTTFRTFILFDVWTYFRQVFVVIFTSHFMLNLRGLSMTLNENDGQLTLSEQSDDLPFIRSIVGNLGGLLESGSDYIDRPIRTLNSREDKLAPKSGHDV